MNDQATCVAPRDEGRAAGGHRPSIVQRRWLGCGVGQPGGKLPLFDEHGQAVHQQTIKCCIREGWAEPWISNPIQPDGLVCRLTDAGRTAISGHARS